MKKHYRDYYFVKNIAPEGEGSKIKFVLRKGGGEFVVETALSKEQVVKVWLATKKPRYVVLPTAGSYAFIKKRQVAAIIPLE